MARRDRSPGEQEEEQAETLEQRAYVHTLSLRLTAQQYRQLRRFVTGHEDRTGRRVTHQAVLEAALQEYLDKQTR